MMNMTLEQTRTEENSASQTRVNAASDERVESAPRPTTSAETVPAAIRPPVTPPPAAKPMEKGRFAMGLLLSTAGITLLMFVAVGTMQQLGVNGWFSMPLVAVTAIGGVMMLGGGFGLMATAAAGLDDGEFERLMEAGNISSVGDEEAAVTEPAVIVLQDTEDDSSAASETESAAVAGDES